MGEGGTIVAEVRIFSDKALKTLDGLSADMVQKLRIKPKTADRASGKMRFGDDCTLAENVVAQTVRSDTSPYVPALTGAMDRDTRVIGNKVIYPGPYSRFLYYGKVMVDPETGSPFARAGSTKVLTDKNLVFNTALHGNAQAFWVRASKSENMSKWKKVAKRSLTHGGNALYGEN